MITKSQLQDGFKFNYGSEIYRVKDAHLGHPGHYYVINERDETSLYVGNVEAMEDEYFTLYTYVMSTRVDVKVNYSECYL
jgi:hypothetical protein